MFYPELTALRQEDFSISFKGLNGMLLRERILQNIAGSGTEPL